MSRSRTAPEFLVPRLGKGVTPLYRGERWGPPVRAEERGPAEHEVTKDAVGTGKQGVRPLS